MPQSLNAHAYCHVLPFVMEDLLHPKARGRAVEQAEQGEVVVLGRFGGQLDHRGRLLEDFAATIEHEMVMRGDEREDDREWTPKLLTA